MLSFLLNLYSLHKEAILWVPFRYFFNSTLTYPPQHWPSNGPKGKSIIFILSESLFRILKEFLIT